MTMQKIEANSSEAQSADILAGNLAQLRALFPELITESASGPAINVDVLKAACRQEMWINPLDAQKRGIHNGDKVRIFNDRGEVHIEAKVTPRMMPGVVALGEGAWYDPDTKRVDKGGCINVLTTQRPSPLAKGNPSHTNLVQVEKV